MAVAVLVLPGMEAVAAGTVALFPFEGTDLPTEVEYAPLGLGKAVEIKMKAAGYDVAEPPLLLRDMMIAVECEKMTGPCATLIGNNLAADFIVVGKLERVGEEVRVRVRRFRVSDGFLEVDVDDALPGKVAELAGAFDSLAARVAEPIDPILDAGDDDATTPDDRSATTRTPGGGAGVSVPGIGVAAGGGLALIIAAVTGARTLSLRAEVRDAPQNTMENFEALIGTRRSGNRFAAVQ